MIVQIIFDLAQIKPDGAANFAVWQKPAGHPGIYRAGGYFEDLGDVRLGQVIHFGVVMVRNRFRLPVVLRYIHTLRRKWAKFPLLPFLPG